MIKFEQKGDFRKLNSFLEKALNVVKAGNLDKYGREGVEALRSATPELTGLAAKSWTYRIERGKDYAKIIWCNTDIEGGYNVALLVQYGHGTRGGTYVAGRDFINPAMRPIFDKIAEDAWKEVNNS